MKTSKIFMTTLVALTMAACSNDNDWVDQSSNPGRNCPGCICLFFHQHSPRIEDTCSIYRSGNCSGKHCEILTCVYLSRRISQYLP